jgi:uncharacterized protein
VATLSVRAGIRGREDPGAWGNQLSVAVVDHPRGSSTVPAQVTSGASEPFVLTDGAVLGVKITTRGVASDTSVTFAAADFSTIGAASAQEIADAINRQTTAVRAAVTPGRQVVLAVVTGDPRGWSRLEVTGPAALAFTGVNANSDAALAAGTSQAVLGTTSGFLNSSAVVVESRGHVVAKNAMLAAVTDGSAIVVAVDGGQGQTITFRDADFLKPAAVTPAEVAAAINRRANGFTAEIRFDNRLVLASASYGPASKVVVTAPPAGTADAGLSLGLETGKNTVIDGTSASRTVAAASETYKLLAWNSTPALPAMPVAATRIRSVEFDLVVRRNGEEVERFESVSMQDTLPYYVEAVVNDATRGSGTIMVTDLDSSSGAALDAPKAGSYRLGSSTPDAPTAGRDGDPPADITVIGDPAKRTGLSAFDSVAIQLLGAPESTSPGVVSACLAYCERRGDAMFVGTVPRAFGLDGAKSYANGLRGRKIYGALYAPWIQVVNPMDVASEPTVWVPPVGQVLGVYARIADNRGVWKAPAGDEARIVDALGVEYDMTDADHTDLVRDGGVNGIRAIPGSGIVVDSSRTLSTDPRWLFVSVRRLFNFVKASLRDGLTWVAQEPNTDTLRRMVAFNVVTPFLLGLWRQGAFGSDPPDQVFTVKCDAENNPAEDVLVGLFNVEIYFYPAKPAESILILVGQQQSGASAREG